MNNLLVKPWNFGDSYFNGDSYKTRALAFAAARKNGSGVFTYKGKLYNTMLKGENADEFRKAHADYDYFLGNVASNLGGWKSSNPIQTSYKVNNVPDAYTKPLPKSSNPQTPVKTKLSMFTNDDIRNLGFRNYAGMVSAVGNQANANNNFVKAMIDRYGSDTSKWNLGVVENDLGVNGTYRSFGRGDFGDMSRAMAGWIGLNNGEIDKLDLQNRTGSDGVIYSDNKVKNLFDSVQLPKKLYTFNFTPIGSKSIKFKQGGQMYKYRTGAQMVQPQLTNSQDPIDLLALLAVGSLLGDKASKLKLIEVLSNELVAPKLLQMVDVGVQNLDKRAMIIDLAIKALLLGITRKARLGAKLDYIKLSIGECPEGLEVVYFKKGGEICKMCAGKKMQDGGKSDPIKEFKKKKVNKHLLGGTFKLAFDNAYGKQRYFTWNGKVYAAYKGDKATDLGFLGAIDNLLEQANALKDYNAGSHLGWDPGANKTTAIKHNSKGNMLGVVNDVVITGRRISPGLKANNLRKRYFDLWTAYVKKWHPNMLGRFKNTMQNMGYKYDWNTGIYSKSGSSYRLNNGLLQTQNIYTGNWNNINNSDALPGMPANGLSMRLQK